MTDREAMEQALDALELVTDLTNHDDQIYAAIDALRDRLAQPEQEPFGYFQYDPRLDAWVQNREGRPGTPCYTTPPQRKPLTHPQIHEFDWPDGVSFEEILLFVRAVEAAHGIKVKA